jgi:FO synthase
MVAVLNPADVARSRDPDRIEALLGPEQPLQPLLRAAWARAREAHGDRVTYSPKVFIPLTTLCRDNCGYCTFAHPPQPGQRSFMTEKEVLAVAAAGAAAGCSEALFTLGDRPERRYRAAREELSALGFESTIDYLAHVAQLVIDETGLIPHVNPGVLSAAELERLRAVSASGGLMLEQVTDRLLGRGLAHWASPDKRSERRVATIQAAGELSFPFTTGLLIGIGETLRERAETIALVAQLSDLPHVQEVIVQNFQPKPGTAMAAHPAPSQDEFLRAIAVTRLACAARASVQAPPNLAPGGDLAAILSAGIDDWGGVSPVTVDHVNPEAPWPALERLEAATRGAGLQLVPRLCVYPSYISDFDRASQWLDPQVMRHVLAASNAEGLARQDRWWPAAGLPLPAMFSVAPIRSGMRTALARAEAGEILEEREIQLLLEGRGKETEAIAALADDVRRQVNGDTVTYVVNRNINYTNICYFRCQFCAFSKGKLSENLRGRPELLSIGDVVERAREAVKRGATEVCMQGGIHPSFTGDFYIELTAAVKSALPELHIHAFSPLEVHQGAATADRSVAEQLTLLREAGLGTLPGTAAEILDDRIRRHLCPDKISTAEWVSVVEEAHRQGLRTTSTIMFGSIDGPEHWARHLVVLRDLQSRTGGITEFVPLPFVHMEAPIYRKGRSRRGPTWEEVVKLHAVARLALRGYVDNIQASWVKCGPEGSLALLKAGVNDLGGTLMNESISRAAGASHGQEVTPAEMRTLIRSAGRVPAERTTTYGIREIFATQAS